jgi:Putative phage tail protein
VQNIFQLKEQALTDMPLLVFECELANGQVERWSTHEVTIGGNVYRARVLQNDLFSIQTASDQGLDAIPRISLKLANADSHFSQLERAVGFKGAKITARFLFYDLRADTAESDCPVLFQGIANSPDEIREATFQLSAINRMSMQRVLLPQVRIQRRCPWDFPVTADQRKEGTNGGEKGRYSRFFRCGYSPDADGGVGNMDGSSPYASCGYTRSDCESRGMFNQDNSGRGTRRFGGVEFVPSQIQVRSYGEKERHLSAVTENAARYNDFVPVVYGTAWYNPPIVFARNDGNLTHLEVLLGIGEIHAVITVLVNGIEIPLGQSGANMSGTGWLSVVSMGNRTGNLSLDFTDDKGAPAGDPYGSMSFLSVVVPNRISDGKSLPNVQVLVEGLKLPIYGSDGAYSGDEFTNNPAWVLLDILQRSGWGMDEIDIVSFAAVADYCGQQLQTKDPNGNDVQIPRFGCNLVLQKRRSAGDVIRGIRNGSRLYLTYGSGGRLQLRVENTLSLQQPEKLDWSNSSEPLNGGWPSYEFGDGSTRFSGILRRSNGEPSIRVWSRSTSDTPNRFAVEFQDELNGYQQDSFELVDVDDVARAGQEIATGLSSLGIPNFDQGARITKYNLDRSIQGNTYVDFETSVRGFGLRPGDLISFTYLKEGFERQPFRVLKISPSLNYRTATITAQIHDDAWYEDTNGTVPGEFPGRQPAAGIGLPRPLLGTSIDSDGDIQFEIVESSQVAADGSRVGELSVGFTPPGPMRTGTAAIPLLSLSAVIDDGGTLAGGQTLYYAISAVDAGGQESCLSFVVKAAIPPGEPTHSVTLGGLSFNAGTSGFHVYRGLNPTQLFRIASAQPVASTFCDSGLPKQVAGPGDANFDHANFYWRMELQPEYAATLHGKDSVGNNTLSMPANLYRGRTARITRGTGAGQERAVISNTANSLMVSPCWDVEPDTTSHFVIAEAGWHPGASAKTSPVNFEIPNRTGAVVEIAGRAANVNNQEAPYELSTITRWVIGGSAAGSIDLDVPPAPVFGLSLSAGSPGVISLSGIGFSDLTNTHTVEAGTVTVYYWNELMPPTAFQLASPITDQDTVIELNCTGIAQAGAMIQIESEVCRVEASLNGGTRYQVTRGMHTTAASAHSAAIPLYHLKATVAIVPFTRDFFGTPACGDWEYQIPLPNVRIASAELSVTNSVGTGPAGAICLTQTTDCGLRTLPGGQYCLQIDGYLAIQNRAVPDLVVEAPHSVRDIFAIVKQAPRDGAIQVQVTYNDDLYCTLSLAEGATVSNVIKGFGMPYLEAGARIGINVLSTGFDNPGSDLTVVIRL